MNKIGRYDVEAEISRGAMGVVHRVWDPKLHRRLAVKSFEIPDGLTFAQRDEFQERFMREARAAAGLSHPGIVTVFDIDWDPRREVPFIAMEYVAGGSLRDRIEQQGRLAPDDAFRIVGRVAEALAVAHRAGIVHRDIKPANMLLCEEDDSVKIADFGVARYGTSELTRTGHTVGSPAHMSPEQIRGRDVDARSDLFSLGVVLYQALCGNHPFPGEDLTGLAYTIVHTSPIPLSNLVPGLPRGIDAFIDRALSKEPGDRFQSAGEMHEALLEMSRGALSWSGRIDRPATPRGEALRDDSGEHPVGPSLFPQLDSENETSRRPRALAVAGTLVALVLGGLFAFGDRDESGFVQLEARSYVRSGVVVLLVDGEAVLSRDLRQPIHRAHLGLTRPDTFEAMIPVAPGRHQIQVHVTDDESGSVERRSLLVEVGRGEIEAVIVEAGNEGDPLTLAADDQLEP